MIESGRVYTRFQAVATTRLPGPRRRPGDHLCPCLLTFELNDEQRALRDTIREFAEAEIAPHAAEWDLNHTFPTETVRKLGELGAMGVAFPEEYGGLGMGSLAQALVVEELARIDSSIAVTVGADVSIAGEPLLSFGTEEQKQRWLVPLARGETLGAFASTEPDSGSDVQAAKTTARHENGCWVINGTKAFTTNAGNEMSAFVIATARTEIDGERKLSTFIVPSGTPGYEPKKPYHKMGWHASDTRELVFTDCRVPDEAMLGPLGKGARVFLTVLDGGRVGIAAMSVGLAQGALEQATAYAKERTAFGAPIARQQAIQFKLAELKTQIEAARLLTYRAAAMKDAGKPLHRGSRRRPSSSPPRSPSGPPKRTCKSTAASATSKSRPCRASTATPRS